jgi:hypothetical protein
MKKDKNKTKVKFLYHENTEDLMAYFPEERYNEDEKLFTCYAHIGQHSACHVDYARRKMKS